MFTVGVSSRSLFSLEMENAIFERSGQEAFDAHMRATENEPLRPGAAYALVAKLLALNAVGTQHEAKRVRVVLLSRNSPEAGMRVMNALHTRGLNIETAVFTRGGDRAKYAKALSVDLFLCACERDTLSTMQSGIPAALVMPREVDDLDHDRTVRIAMDVDSCVMDGSGDKVFREEGLAAFLAHERERAADPMGDGPFRMVAERLVALKRDVPREVGAVSIALVTMRSIPAHGRVINTVRSWGLEFDELIMCGGMEKGPLLRAFEADFFVDDGRGNIDSAVRHQVSAGHVVGQGPGLPQEVA